MKKTFANDAELFEYFSKMAPMKYYENKYDLPKAQDMISNAGNQFLAMRKHDGEWCRAIIGQHKVLLQSRSISRITGKYGDKTENVPHIVSDLLSNYSPGTVLLGELAFNDFTSTSREVGSITRSKPARAIKLQESGPKLHFFIFDVLALNYANFMDLKFQDRINSLHTETKYTRTVDVITSNFWDYADDVWSKGGEGIMIVRKDMKYSPGSRTAWQTLKLKSKLPEMTLPVIGVIEPTKNYTGDTPDGSWPYWVTANDKRLTASDILEMRYLGPIQPVTKPYFFGWKSGVVVNLKGNPVNVASGMTDKYREWLSTDEAQALIAEGKLKAVVTGMELTETSIRHPVLKELKN